MHETELTAPEEPKTAQVNVRLTPSEKNDVSLVAAFDNATESDTMRVYTLAQIRERAQSIREAIPADAA